MLWFSLFQVNFMCQNCYVKVDWKFKIKNSLGVKEPTDSSKTSLMVFCFFKELIQPLMMNLSGKMILKVKSFTHSKSDSCGVSICFIFSKRLFIRNKLSDNDGSILILNVDIDDENFILICITPAPKLSS